MIPPQIKRCSKCSEEKSVLDFYIDDSHKDGYASYCKQCKCVYDRQYTAATYEKRQERAKLYRQRTKGQWSEYHRVYQQIHKKRLREYSKKYHLENQDKLCKKSRDYYRNHKEELAEKKRRNRKKENYYQAVRRARKLNSQGQYTFEDTQILLQAQNEKCLKCKKPFTEKNSYSIDHIVPLSKGGSNDIRNLQLLHRSCNTSKHTKTIDYRSRALKKKIFAQGELFNIS